MIGAWGAARNKRNVDGLAPVNLSEVPRFAKFDTVWEKPGKVLLPEAPSEQAARIFLGKAFLFDFFLCIFTNELLPIQM